MTQERRDTTKIIRERPVLAERFEVKKLLGEGAAGAVFLVKDLNNENREVALKILTNTEAFDENTLQRFLAELHAAKSINHRNVVAAYDFIKMSDSIAYTMEYVEGEDLATILDSRLLTYAEIDNVMTQILSALGELHRQGIMHRDIKLENILVSKDGTAKLVDLGLMKRLNVDSKLTKTGILLGTAQYLPPEYIKHGEYVIESDIYATGLMLFELLSGERRLSNLTGAEAIDYLLETDFKVPRVSNLMRGHVPEKYEEILSTALNPNYKKRYRNADEMAEAFFRKDSFVQAPQVHGYSDGRAGSRSSIVADSVNRKPMIQSGLRTSPRGGNKRMDLTSWFAPIAFTAIGIGLFFAFELFMTGHAIPMSIPYGYYEGLWVSPNGSKRVVYAQVSGSGFFLALNEPRCTSGFVNNSTGIVACNDRSYKVEITEYDDHALAGFISEAGIKGEVVFHYAGR